MTSMLAPVSENTMGADTRSRHVAAIVQVMAALTGWSERTTERKMADAQAVTDRIVEAARIAGTPEYATNYFAHADSKRLIDGDALECTAQFACLVNRDVLLESGSLANYLADKSAAHRVALRKQTVKLQREVAELLAALA